MAYNEPRAFQVSQALPEAPISMEIQYRARFIPGMTLSLAGTSTNTRETAPAAPSCPEKPAKRTLRTPKVAPGSEWSKEEHDRLVALVGHDGSKKMVSWADLTKEHFPGRTSSGVQHRFRDFVQKAVKKRSWDARSKDEVESSASSSEMSSESGTGSDQDGLSDSDDEEDAAPLRIRAVKAPKEEAEFTKEEDALILQFLAPTAERRMNLGKFISAFFDGTRTGDEVVARLVKLIKASGGQAAAPPHLQKEKRGRSRPARMPATSNEDSSDDEPIVKRSRGVSSRTPGATATSSRLPTASSEASTSKLEQPLRAPSNPTSLPSTPCEHLPPSFLSAPSRSLSGESILAKEAAPATADLDAGQDPAATPLRQFQEFTAAFARDQEARRTAAYSEITAELMPTGGAVSAELMEKMMTVPARWAKVKEGLDAEAERTKKEIRNRMISSIEEWYSR